MSILRVSLAAIAALVLIGAAHAETPAGTYVYVVAHSLNGEVGRFTNVIRRAGTEVVVETKLRIEASVLGIVMRRLAEDRRETWRDGRLVAYESTATDDDERFVTTGRAEGDKFVIASAKGRTAAPAGLHTTNPWSIGIAGATVLMGTRRGELNRVTITAVGEEDIEIGGKTIRARRFHVAGDLDRDYWFGADGVLLKQSFPASAGTISFTLINP